MRNSRVRCIEPGKVLGKKSKKQSSRERADSRNLRIKVRAKAARAGLEAYRRTCSPERETKGAGCPHSPVMTKSRMGLRERGAISRSRSGWGRESASPG